MVFSTGVQADTAIAAGNGGTVQAAPASNVFNRDVIRSTTQRETEQKKQALSQAASANNAYNPPLSIDVQPRQESTAPGTTGSSASSAASARLRSQLATSLAASSTTFTPLCATLGVNKSYSLSGTQMGTDYCYHFAVPQRSKTTIFLTGQNASTNFAVALLKDDGSNNVSVVATSDAAGNGDEIFAALTEPGNYYWYLQPNATDGSAFNLGAVLNTQIDAYEMNDTVASATVLPDQLNTLVGNSDSSSDYDHYKFTAVRGQSVIVGLVGVTAGSSNRWIAEISSNASTWQTLKNDSYSTITGLQQNQTLYVRVRPNPAVAWAIAPQYSMYFGTKPTTSDHSVNGESNVVKIPSSASGMTLTTQVARQLGWVTRFYDSKGAPVPGVQSFFLLDKGDGSAVQTIEAVTGSSGGIAKSIDLGGCSGKNTATFTDSSSGKSYKWKTDYDVGAWKIQVPVDNNNFGVGGNNVPYVTLGHICRQVIVQ